VQCEPQAVAGLGPRRPRCSDEQEVNHGDPRYLG